MSSRRSLLGVAISGVAIFLVQALDRPQGARAEDPVLTRWTKDRAVAAPIDELISGLGPVRREVGELTDALVSLLEGGQLPKRAVLPCYGALTELGRREVADSFLRGLHATAVVGGVRQPDDVNWAWPARKGLVEMKWTAVPSILAALRAGDRTEADVALIGLILREAIGSDHALAVLSTEAATVRRTAPAFQAERFDRAAGVARQAILDPKATPWR